MSPQRSMKISIRGSRSTVALPPYCEQYVLTVAQVTSPTTRQAALVVIRYFHATWHSRHRRVLITRAGPSPCWRGAHRGTGRGSAGNRRTCCTLGGWKCCYAALETHGPEATSSVCERFSAGGWSYGETMGLTVRTRLPPEPWNETFGFRLK